MNRLRIAVIFGTFSLTLYFLLAVIAAAFTGQSTFLQVLIAPLSLLHELSDRDQFDLVRDLISVSSLWLAFVCIVDLSVLFSSIKPQDFIQTSAMVNNRAKRLLAGLHLVEAKRRAGL